MSFYQGCWSGSVIQCFFYPWIRDMFFPDLGSRIPNPYFWELSDNFWIKSTVILLIGTIFSSYMKFVAGKTTNSYVKVDEMGLNPIPQSCHLFGSKIKRVDVEDWLILSWQCSLSRASGWARCVRSSPPPLDPLETLRPDSRLACSGRNVQWEIILIPQYTVENLIS